MAINKTAFVFPGQGSQEIGMGQALAEDSAAARKIFDQADQILGFSLSQLCFMGPEADLNDTINTQVAIFTASLAALAALREKGYVQPAAYVAGHSLGEYSAYVAAGVLSFADGLKLVRERGRLMKEAGQLNSGGMAAILKLDDQTVAEICRNVTVSGAGTLQVANYNAPGQVVISGHNQAIEQALDLAMAAKARKAVKLPVSIAAHSELMRTVAGQFRAAVDKVPLNLPEMPIVANITATPLDTLEAIREEMEGQLTASVRWTDSVVWMVEQGVTAFVEIGPKGVLSSLIKRITKAAKPYQVAGPDDIAKLLATPDN